MVVKMDGGKNYIRSRFLCLCQKLPATDEGNCDCGAPARDRSFFKKLVVYSKVPRSTATEKTATPITARWIDTKKGDSVKVDYRSTLLCRRINKDTPLHLFAATSPPETMKLLISKCARGKAVVMQCAWQL